MIRLPRVERVLAPTSRGRPSRRPPRASACTYAGAPPCSGPDSAPTAADSAAPQSAPVEAAMRAVNVEALSPCSAVQIQYVSIARDGFGVGLAAPAAAGTSRPPFCPWRRRRPGPRPSGRRRDAPSARRSTSSAPRCGRDPRAPARRRSRSACRAPTAGEARGLGLQVGRRVAGQAAARTAPARGMAESRSSSTSSPQTLSYG